MNKSRVLVILTLALVAVFVLWLSFRTLKNDEAYKLPPLEDDSIEDQTIIRPDCDGKDCKG
jgi:hypothetical protein